MSELLPFVISLVVAVVLIFVFLPRLAAYRYSHSARTLAGANLTGKFWGMIGFGLDSGYLSLSPEDESATISFTKRTSEKGETYFQLRAVTNRVTLDRIRAFTKKLDAQPNLIQWSMVDTDSSGLLEIDISGPVTADPVGMEGVATGVLAALGYDSSQKYRIEFEGPNDEEKIAEYLRS